MPSLLTDSLEGTVIKCKTATITLKFLRNSPTVRGYAKIGSIENSDYPLNKSRGMERESGGCCANSTFREEITFASRGFVALFDCALRKRV